MQWKSVHARFIFLKVIVWIVLEFSDFLKGLEIFKCFFGDDGKGWKWLEGLDLVIFGRIRIFLDVFMGINGKGWKWLEGLKG
jgi:hypothetical protein